MSVVLLGVALAGWEPDTAESVEAYNEVVDALNAPDPVLAEALALALVEHSPDCGSCRMLLVRSLSDQGRPEAALLVGQELTRDFPDHEAAWSELSACAYAAENFELASEAAQAAVALDLSSTGALSALATAQIRTGELQALDKTLRKAEKVQPHADVACLRVGLELSRERPDEALTAWGDCQESTQLELVTEASDLIARMTESPGASPDGSNRSWQDGYNEAATHYNEQRFGACLEALGRVTPDDDHVGTFYGLQHLCAVGARDLDLANEALVRGTVTAPALYNHALLAREVGEQTRAIELLESQQPPPQIAETWWSTLVQLLLADEQLDRALAVAPNAPPDARFFVGVELSGAGRTTEARELLESTCPDLEGRRQVECVDVLGKL